MIRFENVQNRNASTGKFDVRKLLEHPLGCAHVSGEAIDVSLRVEQIGAAEIALEGLDRESVDLPDLFALARASTDDLVQSEEKGVDFGFFRAGCGDEG